MMQRVQEYGGTGRDHCLGLHLEQFLAWTELGSLICAVHSVIARLAGRLRRVAHRAAAAAVPVKKSITEEYIICLEDGRKFKSLKRHLRTRYHLTPEQYRANGGCRRTIRWLRPATPSRARRWRRTWAWASSAGKRATGTARQRRSSSRHSDLCQPATCVRRRHPVAAKPCPHACLDTTARRIACVGLCPLSPASYPNRSAWTRAAAPQIGRPRRAPLPRPLHHARPRDATRQASSSGATPATTTARSSLTSAPGAASHVFAAAPRR